MNAVVFPLLKDHAQHDFLTEKAVGLVELRDIVCDHFNISLEDFYAQDRSKSYIRAMFVYIVLDTIGNKYPKYGDRLPSFISEFVRRHRTNVYHFKKQYQEDYHLYDLRIVDGMTLAEHFKFLRKKINRVTLDLK